DDPTCVMATLVKRIDNAEEINNPNIVKVLIDKNNYALYFSRSAIPYIRDDAVKQDIVFYKHIGLYAYTKDFLFTFKNLPASQLEAAEKLEQLRVLEAGFKIKTVEIDMETIGVDTPEDLERVRERLRGLDNG
ncbi:cytidylyltransferase domain-containing protein, partial [Candidatus Omnitrophota bacterium]